MDVDSETSADDRVATEPARPDIVPALDLTAALNDKNNIQKPESEPTLEDLTEEERKEARMKRFGEDWTSSGLKTITFRTKN